MSKFTTKVKSFKVGEEEYLGIDVPIDFITELGLVENEALDWEVDTESKVITIRKSGIILNDTEED
jgi:hypothetical protein